MTSSFNRRLVLCVAGIVLCLAIPGVAHATSTFFWMSPSSDNSGNCFQVGTPPTSKLACDSVGDGYLQTHMLDGAVTADVDIGANGDWCGTYATSPFGYPSGQPVGDDTGYYPPNPANDQWWDGDNTGGPGDGSICQAYGTSWGQWLFAGEPEIDNHDDGADCQTQDVDCNMQHWASLDGEVTFPSQPGGVPVKDHPWAKVFHTSSHVYDPDLVVGVNFQVESLSDFNDEPLSAHGFVCPVLEDTSTGSGEPRKVLEFCMETWQATEDSSNLTDAQVGCGSITNGTVCTDWSTYGENPSDPWVTSAPNYSSTMRGQPTGWHTFYFSMSASQLASAIGAANANGVGFSTSPESYALMGVEVGVEGQGQAFQEVGASSSDLVVATNY